MAAEGGRFGLTQACKLAECLPGTGLLRSELGPGHTEKAQPGSSTWQQEGRGDKSLRGTRLMGDPSSAGVTTPRIH